MRLDSRRFEAHGSRQDRCGNESGSRHGVENLLSACLCFFRGTGTHLIEVTRIPELRLLATFRGYLEQDANVDIRVFGERLQLDLLSIRSPFDEDDAIGVLRLGARSL